jgi:flavin-dependent dehydrogenase
MTRRSTLRGAERTPLEVRADVLVCGASFAGLAVARELAGRGADVLVVDRYDIGERATSACAAPTPWLHAMGVERAIRQELECMAFHTPHGSARFRLPWSWSSFDYRVLCEALWEQCDARFEIAHVTSRRGNVAGSGAGGGDERGGGAAATAAGGVADGEIAISTDRGTIRAPLVVDALGWRRVLGPGANVQPPEARISRGLEVHPHDARGIDLDVWIDRSVVRFGYAWSVPAAGERRIGVGSYEPRHHVKEPTRAMAGRLGADAVRYQGNWFPHELRPAAEDGVFFAGDSAGHCLPLSGEGIRTAFYFGIACGRELRAVLAGEQTREQALAAYGAFSQAHAPAFRLALRLQRLIPALPPRALTALLAVMGRRRPCDRAFTWYLEQAHPRFAAWEPVKEGGTPAAADPRRQSPPALLDGLEGRLRTRAAPGIHGSTTSGGPPCP